MVSLLSLELELSFSITAVILADNSLLCGYSKLRVSNIKNTLGCGNKFIIH